MYQRAIDLNPEFLDEALFNLAMVHARLGEQAQCLKKLEQALNVNPQNESAKTYLQQLKGGLKTNHAG
jgi:tetratricopeptide (TPR) repeat protein